MKRVASPACESRVTVIATSLSGIACAWLSGVAYAQPATADEPAGATETAPSESPAAPDAPAATTEPPAAEPPAPPPPRRRTPFDRGRFGLSVGAGATTAYGQRYFGIGAAASYFVLDGVAIDLGANVQWGDGPTIARTTPGLRYVAQPLVGISPVIPYVGVFYSHWFVGDAYVDIDAVGTRGGLLYVSGSVVLGLGIAYERIVSACDPAMGDDCSSIYPDITIAISF